MLILCSSIQKFAKNKQKISTKQIFVNNTKCSYLKFQAMVNFSLKYISRFLDYSQTWTYLFDYDKILN